jgi:hypothetical protein
MLITNLGQFRKLTKDLPDTATFDYRILDGPDGCSVDTSVTVNDEKVTLHYSVCLPGDEEEE